MRCGKWPWTDLFHVAILRLYVHLDHGAFQFCLYVRLRRYLSCNSPVMPKQARVTPYQPVGLTTCPLYIATSCQQYSKYVINIIWIILHLRRGSTFS